MKSGSALELARVGEAVEAAAYLSMIASAPSDLRKRGRAFTAMFGSSTFFSIPTVATLAPNRLLGLGVYEPATEELLDEVVARCAGLRAPRFFVPVGSCALPGNGRVEAWLAARGFRLHNTWVKMHRGGGAPPAAPPSKLKVRRIGSERAREFARTVVEGFGYPANYAEWLACPVGKEDWHHFMAFDGERPVGTGVLFMQGDVGNLLLGSTLRSYRGLGAQTQLFLERLAFASDHGCRASFTETHTETPEAPNPSLHNMLRVGFELAYERPNYVIAQSQSVA